jgi:hypothetical protein
MSSPGDTSRKASAAQEPLKAVQRVGKSRRFRLLLPTIIDKIERGVEHAEIIKALAQEGLELTQGTYFNYLNRYRATAAGTRPRYTSLSSASPGCLLAATGELRGAWLVATASQQQLTASRTVFASAGLRIN